MDYVSALVPPVVMAVFFIGVIRVIVKTQGGANKAKEDAAVDAALARAEGARAGLARDRRLSPHRRAAPASTPVAYDSRFPSRTPFLLLFVIESARPSRRWRVSPTIVLSCASPIGRTRRRGHDAGVEVEPPGDRSRSPGRPSAGTVHRVHHGDDRFGQSPSEGLGAPEAEGRAYRYEAVSTRAAYAAALMNEAWSQSDNPAAALVAFFGMMSEEQRQALRDAVRMVQGPGNRSPKPRRTASDGRRETAGENPGSAPGAATGDSVRSCQQRVRDRPPQSARSHRKSHHRPAGPDQRCPGRAPPP